MFQLTDEQKKLRRELRSFVDREIMPRASAIDKSGEFPRDIFKRLGELGYLDLGFYHLRPEGKYGCVESIIIMEQIARALPSLTLCLSPHVQCMNLIALYGTKALRERVVAGALSGGKLLGFAISEPAGGSEALCIDTTASFVGDGWILNGEKCWITNAGVADGYIVGAKSSASDRYRDVSLFYVDADTPGLDDSFRANLTGVNSSPTGSVRLRNCKVPLDCLVGRENEAYGLMKILFNEGRLDMSALAVGIAEGAMECAIRRTSSAGRFGRDLSSYQGVSFQVARMYEKIYMARNSLYAVSDLFQTRQKATMEVAALKLFSSEMCVDVCHAAAHLHGASGFDKDSDTGRYLRDSQMLTLEEGSSEVCQIVISGKLYHADPGEY